MSRFLSAIAVPVIALLVMVPIIVGIGSLLLAVGHVAAIAVAIVIMVVITAVAVVLDRPGLAGASAAAGAGAAGVAGATGAAKPVPASKYAWRGLLTVAALLLVGIALFLTFAFIQIGHMYTTVGWVVLLSGLIGTPALLGLGVAALLLKPRWA
ncbi:MAG: hypothetical protein U0556_16270 [Dehalococcoidia bacterium]